MAEPLLDGRGPERVLRHARTSLHDVSFEHAATSRSRSSAGTGWARRRSATRSWASRRRARRVDPLPRQGAGRQAAVQDRPARASATSRRAAGSSRRSRVDEHLRMRRPRRRRTARGWTRDRVYELFPRLAERKRNGGAQLSGGEQQMLAIGRALLTNPDAPDHGRAVRGARADDRREPDRDLPAARVEEGIAVLLVEQNLGVATAVASASWSMVGGQIAAETTANALLADPGAPAPLPRRRAAGRRRLVAGGLVRRLDLRAPRGAAVVVLGVRELALVTAAASAATIAPSRSKTIVSPSGDHAGSNSSSATRSRGAGPCRRRRRCRCRSSFRRPCSRTRPALLSGDHAGS